jgi:hypothetical protein
MPMSQVVKRIFQRNQAAALACCLILLTWLCASALEIPAAPPSALDSLRAHARYLASGKLTGRGVDTPGIKLARDYIAREFGRYGLLPGGNNDGYLQSFDVVAGVRVTEPSLLRAGGAALELYEDWIPLGFSAPGKADGGLVFVGYGVTAKDYGYDDYEGVDVKDKIVIVLRYEPPPKNDRSPFRKAPQYSNHAALRAKANNAREHGAAAMILVDLRHDSAEQRELIPLRRSLSRGGGSIIAAQAKRRVVAQWLEAHGVSLAALKEKIDDTGRPASMALPGAHVALTVTLEEIRARADNIVGILPGSDPHLKNEHIVIGAHYDHLGLGHYGTRDSSTEGEIHHGADDNASGTAVLLHLAEQLASANPKPARTTVFVAFSGEELGLFGSRRYVNDPSLALSTAKAMINLDMVGRLRDDSVTVFGARSAQALSGIVATEARRVGLKIRESDGIGRSDNLTFYNKKIPVLHFFTGSHADYHRPSDTWDKLNYDGMYRVGNLVLGTIWRIANGTAPLQFVALPSRPPGTEAADAPAIRTYLGSIPDYDGDEGGVKLSGVSPGSPAARAGLREGDVIVEFAGAKIQNIEDLMGQLSARTPGDEVEIVVLRAGLPQTVKATLAARG